jgi:hypothetical protein
MLDSLQGRLDTSSWAQAAMHSYHLKMTLATQRLSNACSVSEAPDAPRQSPIARASVISVLGPDVPLPNRMHPWTEAGQGDFYTERFHNALFRTERVRSKVIGLDQSLVLIIARFCLVNSTTVESSRCQGLEFYRFSRLNRASGH